MQGERDAGNPVAKLIKTLHLERNRMTLLLTNHLDVDSDDSDNDNGSSAPARQPVEVSLSIVHEQIGRSRADVQVSDQGPAPGAQPHDAAADQSPGR